MYAADTAALLDAIANTKQPDGPRYPATGVSPGRILILSFPHPPTHDPPPFSPCLLFLVSLFSHQYIHLMDQNRIFACFVYTTQEPCILLHCYPISFKFMNLVHSKAQLPGVVLTLWAIADDAAVETLATLCICGFTVLSASKNVYIIIKLCRIN